MLLVALLTFGAPARAALYSSGTLNQAIPDADPNGYANHISVSGFGGGLYVSQVVVRLNISGGYNGDLYGYLSYGGVLVPLLNRVGTSGTDSFGYGDTGFGPTSGGDPFRLSDAGAFDVHNYQDHSPTFNSSGQLTGTWRPDGGTLANFNGLAPNGNWTIFFSDMSGGEQSTLVSWALEIDAIIPEPVGVALGIFGALAAVLLLVRFRSQRKTC